VAEDFASRQLKDRGEASDGRFRCTSNQSGAIGQNASKPIHLLSKVTTEPQPDGSFKSQMRIASSVHRLLIPATTQSRRPFALWGGVENTGRIINGSLFSGP